MCSLGKSRLRGRAIGFVVAGLVALLWNASAPADIIILSDSVSASSSASTLGGGDSFTFSFSGAGNLSASSSASSGGFGDSAFNQSSARISLAGPPGGTQVFTVSLATSGMASSNYFGASSTGSATASGTLNLTAANSLGTQYRLTPAGSDRVNTAASSSFFSSASAMNTDSITATGLGTHTANASSISIFGGDSSDTSFFTLPSVLLGPGIFTFSASTSGSSATSSVFGAFAAASNSGPLSFSFVLEPVPEPATVTLMGAGLLGLAGLGWWRRFKHGE